ncbi:VCBS repeat-containing protein [Coraliomargarita sp. SDUM461004]|uniref:VCBS repeat-containing protein n=1 Tax=Thalassobacterium sedimentorum TaxID=3041258 RepID=A0ABU1AF95_9BACT|nr:VCBS repeat-containing protein [Coraliomargarita sp. SDUM461004]MDQ8193456.1 VCBS repeat-containing protein [Coraliomargarita sp. SDUM461004]
MMIKSFTVQALFFTSCCGSILAAQGRPDFGFGEPKVIKLDWSTRALQVADLDGDGRSDFAVINNDTAQIELLYQRNEEDLRMETKRSLQRDRWEPALEDAGFDSEKITIGFPMFDLGVGDLNGDGRVDLAYTARDVPLTIRFQGESGDWLTSQEFDGFDALGWQSTLKVTDVDGDGQAELVLLTADSVRVFSQGEADELQEAEVYFLTGENPFNLEVVDVTGDGLGEICYVTSEGKQSLVVREQLLAGGFGAERRFILDRPVRMYAALAAESQRGFVSVDSRSGALEFFKVTTGVDSVAGMPLEGIQPQIYSVFKKTQESARYAFGDLNGDGEGDLQVANPAGSELMIFLKKNGRFMASKRFPTFSAISSLTAGRFFDSERDALIALSREEKTLGVSQYDASGRISFPRLLAIGQGEPLVCEAVDLDGDGYFELALISESKEGMQLLIVRPMDRQHMDSEWEVMQEVKLTEGRRKPSGIRALDIFGERGAGLMLFVPREAPILLAPKSGEDAYALEIVCERSSVRESLLKDISSSQVSVIDVDDDGVNELVAARAGFARAIRYRAGELEMVDQFNARRSSDTIAAVIPSLDSDGQLQGLVFYVPKEGELQFLSRDEDGVLRYRHTEAAGSIALSGWTKFGDGAEHSQAYLLYGDDRFWYYAASADSWEREVGTRYETDLEDVYFSHVVEADFNTDGYQDLVAVDGNEHVVEILRGSELGVRSQMFWEIFEQNMHYQGRTGGKLEPRETVTADLNGDGRLDFAFLVHDRIILYLQE